MLDFQRAVQGYLLGLAPVSICLWMLKQIVAQKLNPTLSPKAGDKGGAPARVW